MQADVRSIALLSTKMIQEQTKKTQSTEQEQSRTRATAGKGSPGQVRGVAYMLQGSESPESGDSANYCRLVQTGELYPHLQSALLDRGIAMSRDELKRRFLADVLAKRKANKHGAATRWTLISFREFCDRPTSNILSSAEP